MSAQLDELLHATPEGIRITEISCRFGARIEGLSLPTDGVSADWLRHALDEFLVLVFPGTASNEKEHALLAEVFGNGRTVASHLPSLADVGYPEIAVLDSEQGFRADIWHSDEPYVASPPLVGVLRMVKPSPVGGDTLWMDLCSAYEQLSAPMQQFVLSLSAEHVLDEKTTAVHPLVLQQAAPGRDSLLVSEAFTKRVIGLSDVESRALLDLLVRCTRRPERSIRHKWQADDVVVWNNRATQHFACFDYSPHHRVVHSIDIY